MKINPRLWAVSALTEEIWNHTAVLDKGSPTQRPSRTLRQIARPRCQQPEPCPCMPLSASTSILKKGVGCFSCITVEKTLGLTELCTEWAIFSFSAIVCSGTLRSARPASQAHAVTCWHFFFNAFARWWMPALSQCALNAKILAAESICAVERSFILASNSKYFQMMLAQTCVTVLGLSLGLERDCLFRNTRIRVQTHTCSHTHTHTKDITVSLKLDQGCFLETRELFF